jgi:hypothetical protein
MASPLAGARARAGRGLVTAIALIMLGGCAKVSWHEIAAIELPSPAAEGGLLPNLSTSPQGTVVLSWVERAGDEEHVLRYSVLAGDEWSAPREIARGDDWFVNWADFPSVVAIDESHWAAHWLVKREGGEYAYDVALSTSTDGGKSWNPAVTPHLDGTLTEHGFVSLFPVGPGFDAVWLDGREMAGHTDYDQHAEPGAGAMVLRGARVHFDGRLAEQLLMDETVCDCCQTTAAITDRGIVVAYRDRTPDEVRDISVARLVGNIWQPLAGPKGDHWQINACPVNGPSIDASGNHVALAWFTAADNRPRVMLALSADAGDTFGDAVPIDENALGRVDVVALDDGGAIVSWLASAEKGAEIRLRRVDSQGRAGPTRAVAQTQPARSSGFPQLERRGNDLIVAWTVAGEPPRIRTVLFEGAARRQE